MNNDNDTFEKVRKFRDRRNKSKITKETLANTEKEHPVHTPYVRPKLNWKHKYGFKEDEDIEDID